MKNVAKNPTKTVTRGKKAVKTVKAVVVTEPVQTIVTEPVQPIALPSPLAAMPTKQLENFVVSEKRAYQPTIIIGATQAPSVPAPSVPAPTTTRKTPVNGFGNSKGYGDKRPNPATSAGLLWAAFEKWQAQHGSVPTAADIKPLCPSLGLTAQNKPVNPANVAIELNSWRKYCANMANLAAQA